jgi:hypothetical protein
LLFSLSSGWSASVAFDIDAARAAYARTNGGQA